MSSTDAPRPRPDASSHHDEYALWMQVGWVLALGVVITAFQVNVTRGPEVVLPMTPPEAIEMEDIQQTEQVQTPPPPPRPPIPIEVPNDALVDAGEISFDPLDIEVSSDPGPPPLPEEESDPSDEPLVVVEEMPQLIGGLKALQEAIQYPETARRVRLEGQVIVQFVVDPSGQVRDASVLRGAHSLLNKAALKTVRDLRFTPGKQRGRAVPVQMALPVTFQLQ